MVCSEPGCTGVHHTGKPYATLCPAAKRRHNARPYRQSVEGQTMQYLAGVRYERRRRGRQED